MTELELNEIHNAIWNFKNQMLCNLLDMGEQRLATSSQLEVFIDNFKESLDYLKEMEALLPEEKLNPEDWNFLGY